MVSLVLSVVEQAAQQAAQQRKRARSAGFSAAEFELPTPQGRRRCKCIDRKQLQQQQEHQAATEAAAPAVELPKPAVHTVDDCVYDVVASASGEPLLLPISGPSTGAVPVAELSADATVTIRVFRFFEDLPDHAQPWEKELRNVNSGSLLWLITQLVPKMHSLSGCKYGEYFAVHHLRVAARHFKSGYHMSEGGSSLAKTFGMSSAVTGLISGEQLARGYFWFVSPTSADAVLGDDEVQALGWRHLQREGPYDGSALVSAWRDQGSPLEEGRLQELLSGMKQVIV